MKLQIIATLVITTAIPLMAQETNSPSGTNDAPQVSNAETTPELAADQSERPREKDRSLQKRHLKLMEKALNEIGVTEEQRQKIIILQQAHMEKMKANWKRMKGARDELSRLQDLGASMEELDVAIQEVSDTQTEQLQILVRNRMEMERILGKEKNDLLMMKARESFRSHGRRPGAGMPPRPKVPPMPGDEQNGAPPSPPNH